MESDEINELLKNYRMRSPKDREVIMGLVVGCVANHIVGNSDNLDVFYENWDRLSNAAQSFIVGMGFGPKK